MSLIFSWMGFAIGFALGHDVVAVPNALSLRWETSRFGGLHVACFVTLLRIQDVYHLCINCVWLVSHKDLHVLCPARS